MQKPLRTIITGTLASALLIGTTTGTIITETAQAEDNLSLDVSVFADLRLAHASGEESWLDRRHLGKSRYGSTATGDGQTIFDLAELSLMADVKFGWDWSLFVHAGYHPELTSDPDLFEAFIEYKPAPSRKLSWAMRAGVFFPHVSREHTAIAWTSPYSITPSAINSWIGEEIKTGGLEATANWRFNNGDRISLTANAFGFNETAGTLLHFRGWAFHDAKIGTRSWWPLPAVSSITGSDDPLNPNYDGPLFATQDWITYPTLELDNKVGYFLSLDYQTSFGLETGVQYYDNRGDPTAFEDGQYGWDTQFLNIYAEYNSDQGLTLISQYMDGDTDMGPMLVGWRYPASTRYQSAFLLASQELGAVRLTGRVDWFKTIDRNLIEEDNNNENGWSALLAATYRVSDSIQMMAEYMHISSERPARTELGVDPNTRVNQFQLSLRFSY